MGGTSSCQDSRRRRLLRALSCVAGAGVVSPASTSRATVQQMLVFPRGILADKTGTLAIHLASCIRRTRRQKRSSQAQESCSDNGAYEDRGEPPAGSQLKRVQ